MFLIMLKITRNLEEGMATGVGGGEALGGRDLQQLPNKVRINSHKTIGKDTNRLILAFVNRQVTNPGRRRPWTGIVTLDPDLIKSEPASTRNQRY